MSAGRRTPGGTASVGSRQALTAAADGLFRAIDASTQRTAFDRDYVALGEQRGAKAYYPDAWFHAAWATSNDRAGARYDLLRVRLDDAVGPRPTVRKVLESDPRLEVLVAPDQVAELRAALGDGPWPTGSSPGRGACGALAAQSRPRENADSRSCWE